MKIHFNELKAYEYCDYIPILSGITNTINLVAKAVFKYKEYLPSKDIESYQFYVQNKSILRCVVLIFVPVVGNIGFALYDYLSRKKKVEQVKKAKTLLKESEIQWNKLLNNSPELETEKITLKDKRPYINPKDMSHAIMQGKDPEGRQVIALSLSVTIPDTKFKEYNEEILDKLLTSQGNNSSIIEKHVLIFFEGKAQRPEWWLTAFPNLNHLKLFKEPFTHPFFKNAFSPKVFFQESQEPYERLMTLIQAGKFEYSDCIFELA